MEVARSCSPDGMARGAVTSKARILSRIALVAVGSTELRRTRERLFRFYVRPLVIMTAIDIRTQLGPQFLSDCGAER